MRKAGLSAGTPKQHRSDEGRGVWISAGVFLLAFILMYQVGSRQGGDRVQMEQSMKSKYKGLKETGLRCTEKLLARVGGSGMRALKESLEALQKTKDQEDMDLDTKEQDLGDCESDLDMLRETQKTSEKLRELSLRNKKKDLARLQGALRTSSQGVAMKNVLLRKFLGRLQEKHERMLKKMGKEVPKGGVGHKFVGKVLEKWLEIDKKLNGTGTLRTRGGRKNRGPLFRNHNVLMIEEASKTPAVRLNRSHYDFDFAATHIFFTKRNDTGGWTLPGWHGHRGNREIRSGMQPSALPMNGTLAQQVRKLTRYAMCAVGHNITNFMFPNEFRECLDDDACPVRYMDNFISSPLVHFCYSCTPADRLPVFKNLCDPYKPKTQYDSMLFWRARSRIMLSPSVLTAADSFINTVLLAPTQDVADSGPTKIIAVVVPALEKIDSFRTRETSMTYRRILAGKPYIHLDPASDMPSMKQIAEGIFAAVKMMRSNNFSYRVFVSCPGLSEEGWEALVAEAKDKFPQLSSAMFRYNGEPSTPVFNSAVEMRVAAKADKLLIGRFDLRSAQVAESYLLETRFLPRYNITVW
eukprot:TRINITY_DN248_c1_g3_i1.p1 TRINITY_DN248_c1_g3~~TRINITY_DN248_c1_g3_i1.p1  ORF type:complete len:605 (+),score=191.13 TRINITY_DN248_c1_g3_i1:78-1817(+)